MITDTTGTPRKRPLGITIITILIILTAGSQLLSVFTLYSISSIVGAILYANFLFPLWANPILSVVVLLYLFLNRNVRITFRETAPPTQPVPPMPEQ